MCALYTDAAKGEPAIRGRSRESAHQVMIRGRSRWDSRIARCQTQRRSRAQEEREPGRSTQRTKAARVPRQLGGTPVARG